MKQRKSQQERRQSCGASPCNERFTPKERECWHLQAINRLTNTITKLRKDYNHLYVRNRLAEARVIAQRHTLAEMSLKAENHNRMIGVLRAQVEASCTPIPEFTDGGSNAPES